ncbi:SGNH/GDSL hydrolase family protein [Streptomyces sp. NPDC087844]|uniref:SGNH/GDSL hydrolase family protein n=1 Tax=Streptomyces sp. NPDC087844 TaxID=3365805 RepID=UPI003812B3C0
MALGDSYASGPGIADQTDAACARSDQAYPALVARARQATSFSNVTCSGATTAHMTQSQGTVAPQLDAVGPGTDLVTLTIGGNDIGFSRILGTCAQLSTTDVTGSPCRTFYGTSGTDQLALNIEQTAPKVSAVLAGIKQRAPQARVVVVGYPDLLPDDGVGCFPTVPFAAGDFAYLRDTEKRLNAMLARAARQGHATYVDTYTSSIGHDMCQAAGTRWVEPLTPQAPAAPAHPNAAGQAAMAAAIERRVC